MPKFDFHMHSNISRDGEFTPTQLVEMADKVGLKYIALSDHNNFRGIDEMKEAANKVGIQVIPAIEFDTMLLDEEVHLLGYNIDYKNPCFENLAANIDKAMDDAMAMRFQKFRENFHVTLSEKEVYKNTPEGSNSFFTLVTMMLNDPANKDIPEFKEYLLGGKRDNPQVINFYWDHCSVGTKNYVKVNYPDFKETVDLIHANNGIAILAHPWKTFYEKQELLETAIACGIDGIEAYSNYHEDFHNEYYENICKQHHLIMSCGSDFHGKNKPSVKLGEYGYRKNESDKILQSFLEAIKSSSK